MIPTPTPPSSSTVRIELSTRTVVLVLSLLAGVWALGRLWPVLVVVITGLMLAGTLHPPTRWLENHGWRRIWALALQFIALVGVLGVVCLVTLPSLWHELTGVMDRLPEFQTQLAQALAQRRTTSALAATVRHFQVGKAAAESVDLTAALVASLGALEVVGLGFTAVVLGFYFLADGESTRSGLYAVVPKRFHVRTARVLLNLETIVGGYIRGQLITSLMIGVFTFGLLTAFRVPDALALGALASLTDVIPFVGGLIALVPAGASALSQGTVTALTVVAILIGYQEFESRVLIPRIYGRVLRLSSASVVIALLVGGKLGGIVGALLALPIAAGLRMLVEELRVELPGDDTHDAALQQRDREAERLYAERTVGASPEAAAEVAKDIAENIRAQDAAAPNGAAQVPFTEGQSK